MKKQDDLFELIKSLSVSEKRYFKLSVSVQKGEKNYLKLFDAIDKQEKYNELEIKKGFAGNVFIKQLHRTKYYLYNLILKSLTAYYSSSSVDSELKELLQQVKTLLEKGLYKQCEKIISKTKLLAEKYEKHLALLELSDWEIRLMYRQSYKGKTAKEIERCYKDTFSEANKYINYKEYEQISARMFVRTNKKGYSRTNTDLLAYKSITDHPLLRSEDKTISYHSLSVYYTIYSSYYLLQNDYTIAYSYTQKKVKFMEAHPYQIGENIQSYVTALTNLILCQLNLKKYTEVVLSLKKLKEINTKSQNIQSRIFYTVYNSELTMHIDKGEYTQGIKLIPSIQNGLGKMGFSKEANMILSYGISQVYFGAGNYQDALIYLNKIINDTGINMRSDVYCMVKIMLLIVHFELGNEELLEYMEKSVHRYLDKNERLYRVETSILDFMRKTVPKIITPQERIKAFKKLKAEIEEITQNTYEKKALEYFDFISWLESKIEKRPFAVIVKEKARSLSRATR